MTLISIPELFSSCYGGYFNDVHAVFQIGII